METYKTTINDVPWEINFCKTQKEYNKMVVEDIQITYGATHCPSKTVSINMELTIGDKVSLLSILMHELGHVWQSTLPSHSGWQGTSDICADAFEFSIKYIDLAKKMIKELK